MSVRRREGRGRAQRVGLWLLAVASVGVARSAGGRSLDEPLPPTNLAVLQETLTAAARDLVDAAPLEVGSRLAVRATAGRDVDREVMQALLAALVARGVEAWPVSAPPAEPAAAAATVPTPADTLGSSVGYDLTRLNQTQNTKADTSPGAGASGDASGEWPSTLDLQQLPVLEVSVEEARVEYTRLHRAGVLGAQHVERRAVSRLAGRLLRPQTRTVYWVGASDSSYADVVPRSELKALEDANRPELRGTVPVQGWTKAAEPILVGALIVGLVALFYTNRP